MLVAFSRNPSFYLDLMTKNGLQRASIRILDCYSDPHGWRVQQCESATKLDDDAVTSTCRNVKDVDGVFSSIISLGRGMPYSMCCVILLFVQWDLNCSM